MNMTDYKDPLMDDDPYIDVVCLSCFKELKIPVQYAGASGRCKYCGAHIDVPHVSGVRGQPRRDAKVRDKTGTGAAGGGSSVYTSISENVPFLSSLAMAAVMSILWSLILLPKEGEKTLFLLFAVLSCLIILALAFFVFGRKSSDRAYLRLGLREENRHNLPLNVLYGILLALALSHLVPIGPFVLNVLGLYAKALTAHALAINFLCFSLFPLVVNTPIRKGNLWVLAATFIMYAGLFVYTYFSSAKASGFSTFNVYYFIEIFGFAPFLYWAVSGVIYILSMAALFACWRQNR
ncbi:MAG TPA: hypothetical protein PLC40_19545 [Candidatus Hydrogenedentes bacterium]|nr:hypothetical protein [Candidatus Hydrogenedentota bacterium]